MVTISAVQQGSVASQYRFSAGDSLLQINGNDINDVLDYRFYMMQPSLDVSCTASDGEAYTLHIKKDEYDELGLLFETYLMDKQQQCKNRCIFCFIDQMPPGLRDSLYFKDDDSRLSFLFGNYITLTNLQERDIQRILTMHISPVNVSIHTMNPKLRVEMMKNPHSGEVLRYVPQLAQGGIKLNTQIVLCPNVNDGDELDFSLNELCKLAPNIQSIAVVPVGLTKFREGLEALNPFTKQQAADTIKIIDKYGNKMLAQYGQRICFASDEFYLKAQMPIPDMDFYEDFAQLENGVGMISLLRGEFMDELSYRFEELPSMQPKRSSRTVHIATGVAAAPLMKELSKSLMSVAPEININITAVRNDFFGHNITVAGLVTGRDLLAQLPSSLKADALLIPETMLRHEGDLFIDGISLDQVQNNLGLPVRPVPNSGVSLLDEILGNYS